MTNGKVVVLGTSGRNFAAGMSGGIAYVLDEVGEFARFKCNQESVDLLPVSDPEDQRILRELIQNHVSFTGSPKAKWILEHWQRMLPRFVKVFPHEFQRVLGLARAAALVKDDAVSANGGKQAEVLHG